VGVWVTARVLAWWLTRSRLVELVAVAKEMVAVGGHGGKGRERNKSFDVFGLFYLDENESNLLGYAYI